MTNRRRRIAKMRRKHNIVRGPRAHAYATWLRCNPGDHSRAVSWANGWRPSFFSC